MAESLMETKGAEILRAAGQAHLMQAWQTGADEDRKRAFLQSVVDIDGRYPGGVKAYVAKGRRFLEESKKGDNPLKGVVPEVPQGLFLDTFGKDFLRYEGVGAREIRKAAFVLVAGGLGERLGYDGIKIELPTNLLTEETYLALYCQHIRCYEKLAKKVSPREPAVHIPLVIMTSGDTHAKTVSLLTRQGYFGLSPSQVTIVKQEKVPAMKDNSAAFVTEAADPYTLSTKPHGNGDVHLLLHQHGIADRWVKEGRKWVVFFQDTNGLAFNTVLPTIGLAASAKNAMTSVCVPRVAGEAIGCITSLKKKDGTAVVCNVEYNQIDPLLKAVSGGKLGDVADPKTGFSAYPGNTNTLVIAAERYAGVLHESGGVMPEFVNPKYANAEKTVFKSPTRLECMMEDYPKLLTTRDNVGFASFDRWASFSPCKNNLQDARAKSAAGQDAWGAFSAEADFYRMNVNLLRALGVRIAAPAAASLAGVEAPLGALVWFSPSFSFLRASFPMHFPTPSRVTVSSRSALVIDGDDVRVDSLHLDGALVIDACEGAHVHIVSLTVKNRGWTLKELTGEPDSYTPYKRIRGYSLEKHDQMVLRFTHPGTFIINDQAKM